MPSRLRATALVLAALLSAGPAAAVTFDSVDFFRAVNVDNADAVTRMLAAGLDPNQLDPRGQPALIVALQGESLKVAKVLWDAKGIDIDVRNHAGETPLMMAALKAEVDAAGALVAHGAAVQKDGWAPLHYAATGGSAAIVKLLLAKGAVLETRSPNGTTPLMMAARYGSPDSVQVLLDHGADPKLRNDLSLSAADFAQQGGRPQLQQKLAALAR